MNNRTELLEKRTANSKTFQNKDHSFTKEIYLDKVHYQDEEGRWQELDNSLTEEAPMARSASPGDGGRFVNVRGDLKTGFSKEAEEGNTLSLERQDKALRWSLEGAKAVKAVRTEKQVIFYPEILPGVESRCRIAGNYIKEDVIFQGPDAPEATAFLYRTANLVPALEIGCVIFRDEEGEEAFRVSAPYIADAAGKKSEALSVSMEPAGKDTYRIVFHADREWLAAPERVYPLTLDPVTTTSKKAEDIQDAHVDSRNYIDNFQNSILLKTMGGDNIQRSFLKFQLPEIKTGDMVVGARLVLVSLAEDGKERTIQVHKVLQNWDSSTITWQNKPIYEETIEDLCKFKGDKQKYVTLDITRLVKDWYQNGKNYGLMFRDNFETSGYTEFLSADCHDDYQDMRPRIDISYMNYSGREDYWSYHTQEAGRAGTVYVNDYNGNLMMEHSIMGTGGSRMPAALSLIYNSNDRLTNGGYGYGCRLNYQQLLKKVKIAGTDYYQHTDGDGTVHYFYYDSAKKVWKEESGLEQELLIKTGEAEPYIIEDKEDNQLVFDSAGKLIKVKDKNNNAVTIAYSGSRITKVTDGAGRALTLTYLKDSKGNLTYLSKVQSPAGQTKSFAFADGHLTSITDIDGAKVSYTFHSTHMLTGLTNVDGYRVAYTYWSTKPYRVKKIAEYGGSTAGNSLNIVYGHNSTQFTDNKGRKEIYRFNNSGNLLHIHDDFGHASSAKFNGDGKHVNRLENESLLQDNVVQLLKDPIIQNKTVGWKNKVGDAANMKATINTTAKYCKVGSRSLKLESTVTDDHCYWYQDAPIEKGKTYTFSMYVYTALEALGTNGKCALRVQYADKAGTIKYADSEPIVRNTASFVRLSCTFTVPKDSAKDFVRVCLWLYHASGAICGDMAQLEPGTTPNRCNLIYNGDFILGKTSGFTKSGATYQDVITTAGTEVEIPAMYGLTVTASSGTIRKTPDPKGTAVSTMAKGTHFAAMGALIGSDGKYWYYAKGTDGKWGYIPEASALGYEGGSNAYYSGAVAVSGAILRSKPAASSTPVQEWIPKDTPLFITKGVTDSSGCRWYECGFSIATKRYTGYLSQNEVIRLNINDAYGTMMDPDKLYASPSRTSKAVADVASGTTVRFRGGIQKTDGSLWGAVLRGKTWVFVPTDNMALDVKGNISRVFHTKADKPVGELSKHILKFSGDPAANKKLTQTLEMAGKKGDTYMVNAWGRGTCLPETDNDKARRFGVEVVFTGSDGKTDVHYTNFSPDILDWQFLSDVYVAKMDYVKVAVSYTYCHNANVAFFDGLSLFREEFGRSYTYDGDNNVISVVDADKKATKFAYNEKSDLTGLTDARGSNFKYEYDAKHNVTKGTSAANVVHRLSYDAAGNIVKSGNVDPKQTAKGVWTARTMDSKMNHVLSVTDAAGNKTQYAWDDKKDTLTSLTDARGNKISYTYDTADRLKSVSQSVTVGGAKKTVTNTYTYTKDLLTGINHNGFDYGFTYDAFGNTKTASIAGTKVISYEYGANNGTLTKLVYGNGDYIRYVYDKQDRVTMTYYYSAAKKAEQKLNEYVYDRQGNLSKVVCHMAGKTYYLSYDFLGRLMRVVDERKYVCMYEYDAMNNMTRVYNATTAVLDNKYTYDKDGREILIKGYKNRELATAYDVYGRLKSRTWKSTTPWNVTYTYAESGNNCAPLPNKLVTGNKTFQYTYDKNWNITKAVQPTGEEQYQYDERNQLIRENSKSQNKTIVYAYDIGGNITSVKEYAYTTAATLPATPTKTISAAYDAKWKDKLVKWNGTAITYDAIGNMLTKGSVKYTWTLGRKLSTVNNGKAIQYFYDHNGMRTKKTVAGVTTEFCYAGELLLSQGGTSVPKVWFSYDSSGNLAYMSTAGKNYFYVKNLQNDILGMVDDDGKLVVEYKYDSWGKVLSVSGSLKDTVGKYNPFRYRGYYYDEETGMYYVKSRYYDPEIKRFISADDISVLTLDLGSTQRCNLYAYCMENPANMVDADGEFAIAALAKFAVEAVVGGVVNMATSYIAAKVTGQDWGMADAGISFVSGALCALSLTEKIQLWGKRVGAIVSGGYAIYNSRKNNVSWSGSLINGAVSAFGTRYNASNYGDVKIGISISTNAAFSGGANLTGAAVNAAVVGNRYTNSSSNKKKASSNVLLNYAKANPYKIECPWENAFFHSKVICTKCAINEIFGF